MNRSGKLIALLGSASALALASVAAQAQDGTVAEEVLITGSLIRGAEAVGVPVTQLGAQEFAEQAAVTVSDVLRAVPSVSVFASTAHAASGSNLTRAQRVSVHGQGAARTLMLIDGMRFPLTGVYYDGYDPSIIPGIALERMDVLADGASATYGSDAVAGVINLVLRRGYDGAISQFQYSIPTQGGGEKWQFSQLWGTTWDGGDITIAFDYYDEEAVRGPDRDRISWDFTPWGLDNRIPLRSSLPATVHVGNAALPSVATNPYGFSGSGCTNCLLVPKGQNGIGLTWATLLANPMIPQTSPGTGTNNLIEPHKHNEFLGQQQRAGVTVTFDQRITENIELFVDGFYSNRRAPLHNSPVVNPWPGGTFNNFVVPANNPYYPIGAPANVRVDYSTALELDLQMKGKEVSARWAAGFNIDLPFDWQAKVFYAIGDEKNRVDVVNTANQNNILAALGNVVFDPDGNFMPYVVSADPNRKVTAADLATQNAAIKAMYPAGTDVRAISPTQVPFMNVFCDPAAFVCNDPRTLDFIRAHWIDDAHYQLHQTGGTFDGPLFEVPGGEVQAAVGFSYTYENLRAIADRNQGLFTAEFTKPVTDVHSRNVWAVFGQVNVPIFGDGNAVPGLAALDLEVSGRYDHYSDFGGTFNPKFGANWSPFEGLTVRGTWGTSFAAPSFLYLGLLAGKNTSPQNIAAGATSNSLTPLCAGGATATAGTAAADILNAIGIPGATPDCSNAAITAALAVVNANPAHPYFGYTLDNIRNAGILSQNGGAAPAYGVVRPPGTLGPEEATNWSVGFDFSPEFIPGLNVHATYFNVLIEDFLAPTPSGNNDLNLPEQRQYLTVRGADANNPAATFDAALAAFLASPALASGVTVNAGTISVLRDQMARNLFEQVIDGVDFGASYDFDLDNWGAWQIGFEGTYLLRDKQTPIEGGPSDDTFDSPANGYGVAGNTEMDADTPGTRVRVRGNLGWEDLDTGWSADFFVNYRSHYFTDQSAPNVNQISALTGIPVATLNGPAPSGVGTLLQQYQQEISLVPEQYTFDISIGYDLGDRPANDYLKNLAFRLTVNDILDRELPFLYRTANNGAGPLTFDGQQFSPLGRTVSFAITKTW